VDTKLAISDDRCTERLERKTAEALESIDIPFYRKTTARQHSTTHRTNNIFIILY